MGTKIVVRKKRNTRVEAVPKFSIASWFRRASKARQRRPRTA